MASEAKKQTDAAKIKELETAVAALSQQLAEVSGRAVFFESQRNAAISQRNHFANECVDLAAKLATK